MSLKYGVFCITLLFVVIFLAIKSYGIWTRPMELPLGKGVEKKTEAKAEVPPMMGSSKEPSSNESYIFIAEKNIFSPERKDFPIPAAMAEAKKPIVRPQIALYGVAIATDYQSATVSNPGRPLGKEERETLTIKIGEKIGEYQLAKILPDRIAMESNGDTFEVRLYDSKNPNKKMEARTETQPAMIASPQLAPVPPSGETPKPTLSRESVQKPKEPFQAQGDPSLPFNKYTYHLFPSPAERRGRRIFYSPPGPPGPSAQEPVGN